MVKYAPVDGANAGNMHFRLRMADSAYSLGVGSVTFRPGSSRWISGLQSGHLRSQKYINTFSPFKLFYGHVFEEGDDFEIRHYKSR